ncbi:MAG: bacillithiol biosynthesis cysteine-adding enzyme BshC [Flavobacteriaceae bacterium]
MNTFDFDFATAKTLSPIVLDYLNDDDRLNKFHAGLPSVENLLAQAQKKKLHYPQKHRETLLSAMEEKYAGLELHPKVEGNLQKLRSPNTFTVCTGHQLNLMTGPLYSIYKILTTIKLADQLNAREGDFEFVPVFWMASEDHDFEEISFFQSQGKKFQWNTAASGAVGRMPLDDLEKVLNLWESEGLLGPHQEKIRTWIAKSYSKAQTLSEASFLLVHQIFQHFGLLILDADHSQLKALFAPYMQQELKERTTQQAVNTQITAFQKLYQATYKPQVNPREINLFYLTSDSRKRIIALEDGLSLEDRTQSASMEKWLEELAQKPENFSPNVLMRPLYQECILPNVAYIGGGGELAYWLQLQKSFEAFRLPFPLLLVRQSALLFKQNTHKKWSRMGLALKDVFLDRNTLINKKIRLISNIDLDFGKLKSALHEQFSYLDSLVIQTDPSFEGALAAQKRKQIKGLEHLEKRLLKAQKRKLKDQVSRLVLLHENFFPGEKIQERTLNFMDFYAEEGPALLDTLYHHFSPLHPKMLAVELL